MYSWFVEPSTGSGTLSLRCRPPEDQTASSEDSSKQIDEVLKSSNPEAISRALKKIRPDSPDVTRAAKRLERAKKNLVNISENPLDTKSEYLEIEPLNQKSDKNYLCEVHRCRKSDKVSSFKSGSEKMKNTSENKSIFNNSEKGIVMKNGSDKAYPLKSEKGSPMKSVSERRSPLNSVSERGSPLKSVSEKASPMKSVSERGSPLKIGEERGIEVSLGAITKTQKRWEHWSNSNILHLSAPILKCPSKEIQYGRV